MREKIFEPNDFYIIRVPTYITILGNMNKNNRTVVATCGDGGTVWRAYQKGYPIYTIEPINTFIITYVCIPIIIKGTLDCTIEEYYLYKIMYIST